ncbi:MULTISPECIES: hypothetical protein [Virgibacillus]|uniref:hypothetical protein n=1 Tax=Virgibacillus TaxID=84406 RepID=UPI0003886EEF|nr:MULTISPECIES: hypothetical protein [Virgibacillus]EQB36292.1 hypothetical protein M948_14755 [Virgibacillus sp. CM-4]MYL42136.1 hypothetical protein [Virgibacillus massiliensis]
MIQKSVNNSSSEELTKMVNEKQKIKQILTIIEGLKVKRTTSEKVFEKMKTQDNYTFAFSEGKELKVGKKASYAFYVLEDGTFIFPYSDVNSLQEPLITIKKHKELLGEIKELSEVDF